MSAIAGLLDQARSLRLSARSLISEVAAHAEERAQAATQSNTELERILRSSADPAELKAYYAKFAPQYQAAKGRQAQLEAMAQRIGTMATQLAAAAAPSDASLDQIVLGDEIKQSTALMGELTAAVQSAVLETGVAAALAGIAVPGRIIGARTAAPHIIRPEGFGLIVPKP